MPQDNYAPGTPDKDTHGTSDAFPIEPPSPCSESESPAAPLGMLSDADLAALADDVPSRLRTNVLRGHAEAVWQAAATEPAVKSDRLDARDPGAVRVPESPPAEREQDPFVTSDSFAATLDDWDLDDSQLYSDEVPLLMQPEDTRAHAPPAGALQRLMATALEQDDSEVAGGALTRVRGDLVLAPGALSELLVLLRRATGSRAPLHDVDMDQLSRLLALLERTMQGELVEAEAPPNSQTIDADVDRIAALSASLVAAQCALTVLLVDQLPKYLMAEELVAQCLTTVAASMDTLVLPLVEACSGGESVPSVASIAAALAHGAPAELSAQLSTHFEHFSATLLQVEGLFRLSGVSIADALLIRSVYLALAPFFAQGDAPRTKQRVPRSTALYVHAGALRPLRMSALELLRSIFAHYPAQRHWVLGEILVSLLRLPDLRHKRRQFRLANGRTVFTITALLLQLIQAAAHAPPALHTQTLAWLESGDGAPPLAAAFHAVQTLASTIAVYLCQRAAESKLVKSTHDLSYASVIYYLMEDLMALLLDPACPAAGLLMSCFCRVMIAALEDPHSSIDAKSIALDHLGVVAARLRRCEIDVQAARREHLPAVRPLAVIAREQDTHALAALADAHSAVLCRLKHASDAHAAASAAALSALSFQYEIVLCMEHCGDERGRPFGLALLSAYHQIATAESAPPPPPPLIWQLVLQSPFVVRYASLVGPLVHAVGSAALATRARALRALGNVCTVDASILDNASVRRAIAVRLADSSASVRETAVAILSPYVLTRPHALGEHGAAVAARVADAAPAVRRRALHFLHGAYLVGSVDAKVSAAVRILRCIYDIDAGLQTLARQILEQLWFPGGVRIEAPVEAPQPPLAEVAAVLVGVASRTSERPSPLAELLRLVRDAESGGVLDMRLGALVDTLISSLFSGDALDPPALLNRVRTVHTLVSVQPTVLTVARAKQLLPYIAGGAAPDETALLEELLRVFRTCLGHLPRTARALGESLERILVPLVSRCTLAPGSTVLQELVACLCAVVHHQTHNTAIILSTADACVSRLEGVVHRAAEGARVDRAAYLAMCIAALVSEHGALDALGRGHLVDRVFALLVALRDDGDASFRVPALIAMGYILRARPARFVDVSDSLDLVLMTGSRSEHGAVLRILLDTLSAEASASAPQDSAPMDVYGELAGSSDALADSSVASALMQRFAAPALESTLAMDEPPLQATAMEILSLAVLQGLCHPLQCVPYLVALETAPDTPVRARALRLHMHLAARHAALLATRFGDGVRKSYEFQRALGAVPLGYVEPSLCARLADWYALVREKRHTRTEFLRALVRMLDGGAACDEAHARLAQYVVENLATLEYRVADELLVVLGEVRVLHAGAGQQVAASARRALGAHERERELSPLTDEEDAPAPAKPRKRARRSSVAASDSSDLSDVSLDEQCASPLLALARRAAVLRATHALERHLKQQYRLSDKYVHANMKTVAPPRPI